MSKINARAAVKATAVLLGAVAGFALLVALMIVTKGIFIVALIVFIGVATIWFSLYEMYKERL